LAEPESRAKLGVQKVMSLNPPPSPCSICGGTQFAAASNHRLASSGMPSRCQGCGSLERERIVRAVFNALPKPLFERAKCLRFEADPTLNAAWFGELTTLDAQPAAAALGDLPSSSYQWVFANLPLTSTGAQQEQRTLQGLLRVAGSGFVVLGDGALADRYAPAEAQKPNQAERRLFGPKYTAALGAALPSCAVLELVALDSCSLSLDSVFIVSLDAGRLLEMAASVAEHNIHARVFAAGSPGPAIANGAGARAAPGAGESQSPPALAAARAAVSPPLQPALPADYDEVIYRSLHADLTRFAGAELLAHYQRFGQSEGRRAHALETRRAFAGLLSELEVLEIGPYHDPLVTGPRVRYFDLYDRAGIVARAAAVGYPTHRTPEIHYVSASADLGIVDGSFDAVISSHVVEHQPDLVGHLDSVRRLLRPGGRYFALIPDKNYCFDHFMAPSTIAELLEAHLSGRTRHTMRSQIAYAALKTHNDPKRHWRGDHAPVSPSAASIARAAEAHLKADGSYSDVHAWYFDPTSFRQAIELLNQLGETDFKLARLYPTQLDCNEFWVVLEAAGGAA
jgi:SAM-dependent methyltransferase